MKTPKHVVLPLTVRHLTRSSQLVEILNHFGHSLSNSLIQEVETSMAERHLKLVEVEDLIYTPPNIQPNVPFVMCWDNNDISEETLSGHGTAHCTNEIIIQRNQPPPPAAAAFTTSVPGIMSTRRNWKISFTPQPSKILPYNSGKRCSPGNIATISHELRFPKFPNNVDEVRQKNTAWCMLRSWHNDDDTPIGLQLIPGWSGFNAVICHPPKMP